VETYLNTGGGDKFFIRKDFPGVEAEFIQPFIKSPSDLNEVVISPGHAKWKLLLAPKSRKAHKSGLRRYLAVGIKKKVNLRSNAPAPWWILPKQAYKPGKMLHNRIHHDSHAVFLNKSKIANTNFYALWPLRRHVSDEVWVAYLNSTFFAFQREFMGRVNFGMGALKTEGTDIKKFLVVKSELLKKHETQLKKALTVLSKRPIRSLFDDIGASKREDVDLNNIKSDRRALDKIVMGDILGLTDEEQLEVYRAVVDLVKSRLEKAKSADKGKTRDGLDIDMAKKSVFGRIEGQKGPE
jgi:hypothetical protein